MGWWGAGGLLNPVPGSCIYPGEGTDRERASHHLGAQSEKTGEWMTAFHLFLFL